MIEIKDLTKNYGGLEVLRNITLTIHTKDIYGIVGESGAGKSTLLRCINGLEKYDSGSLSIDGTEVKSLSEIELRELRKNIGMVFQNFSLVGRKTVFQNIALPMECWGATKEEIDKKVRHLAELVGLSEKLKSRPRELSGGQMQRVAVARALTMEPKYILCDECTSALDPKTTLSILEMLENIRNELGVTIIMVTHEMSVVQSLCDRMAIIRDGMVAEEGGVSDLFFQNSETLQNLLGVHQHEIKEGEALLIYDAPLNKEGALLWGLGQCLSFPYTICDSASFTFQKQKRSRVALVISGEEAEKAKHFMETQGVKFQIKQRGGM